MIPDFALDLVGFDLRARAESSSNRLLVEDCRSIGHSHNLSLRHYRLLERHDFFRMVIPL
jgi:hypothetical protein